MPNWCLNELSATVIDDTSGAAGEALDAFVRDCGGTQLSFNACPTTMIPPMLVEAAGKGNMDVAELRAECGVDSIRGWCIKMWGTKWDAADAPLTVDRDVFCQFDTAWGPPLEWLRRISEAHPAMRIELQYEEPGCDFCGTAVYAGGVKEIDEELVLSVREYQEGVCDEGLETQLASKIYTDFKNLVEPTTLKAAGSATPHEFRDILETAMGDRLHTILIDEYDVNVSDEVMELVHASVLRWRDLARPWSPRNHTREIRALKAAFETVLLALRRNRLQASHSETSGPNGSAKPGDDSASAPGTDLASPPMPTEILFLVFQWCCGADWAL